MHGVGIMAQNHPNWFVSSLASIFAGGLCCGIYTTSSPATVKYICGHAPVDVLILQDHHMLENLLEHEPEIHQMVQAFILMEDFNRKSRNFPIHYFLFFEHTYVVLLNS